MKIAFALAALLANPAAAGKDVGTLIVVYQAAPANRARSSATWKAQGRGSSTSTRAVVADPVPRRDAP